MLLQPRIYKLRSELREPEPPPCAQDTDDFFGKPNRVLRRQVEEQRARKMLLIHQAGSLKIGETVRYTCTYTPSDDRILPTPGHLHVKIKNTSAIPLRAAWVHGPYALHVSAYPSTFNPHQKIDDVAQHGAPDYEPMLKAGGSWHTKLTVPSDIRESGADLGKRRHSSAAGEKRSVTWIIEITSQILFSTSASVNYEVLVGRDERSLDLGFAAVAGHGHSGPGQLAQQPPRSNSASIAPRAGVFSKAIQLVVENVETLWNKPALPSWEDVLKTGRETGESKGEKIAKLTREEKLKKRKRIHLVILTHGLHSNLGADMLFLKESIDATARQARLDARERKRKQRGRPEEPVDGPDTTPTDTGEEGPDGRARAPGETATAPLSGGQEEIEDAPDSSEDEDDEETIVRGFPGNAAKTENGIQYLGKRLAKYILRFTYPDQPFLPIKKTFSKQLSNRFRGGADKVDRESPPAHQGSSIRDAGRDHQDDDDDILPYHFTSISFIGHSLGGLIQTYAVAYIQKHSPKFFEQIKPVNFICMASPMLGLSNENPMYVKFALDFGLVGRTGQDLGLTWRPPTIARGGWNAVIGGLGVGQKDKDNKAKQEDPAAKPLLRILPTGPAHHVLRLFRNRTVYSNVVNDGIVPLRTSCLLFLDWRGLGKVEKARRENGLIGTVAEWGWAELTGANSSSIPPNVIAERWDHGTDSDDNEQVRRGEGETVPQPPGDETSHDNRTSAEHLHHGQSASSETSRAGSDARVQDKGLLGSMMDFFRPKSTEGSKPGPNTSKKTAKAFRRAQTVQHEETEGSDGNASGRRRSITDNPTMRPHLIHLHSSAAKDTKRPAATRGDSTVEGELSAPPKTSIFESAGDILHPPLPSRQWIIDPSSRARTIFHDRVYHPEDIPPPPSKRAASKTTRASSRQSMSSTHSTTSQESETGGMKVEEKIARAYHRDLSWRKVLVRLEPDAHNNMIVRRMFANAYGWPVVKHLCDTHFADTFTARTRDEDEPAKERAPPMSKPVPETGEEVQDQVSRKQPQRSDSEMREARDELTDLGASTDSVSGRFSAHARSFSRRDSEVWDDAVFEGSDNDDSDVDERNLVARLLNPYHSSTSRQQQQQHKQDSAQLYPSKQTSPAYDTALDNRSPRSPPTFVDGHRGLSPTASPTSSPPSSPSKFMGSTASAGLPRTPSSVVAATQNPLSPVFDSGALDDTVHQQQPDQAVASKGLVAEPESMQDRRGDGGDGSPRAREDAL